MDYSRPYHGHFKQYAFVWKPIFSQRRTRNYPSEDRRYVERRVQFEVATLPTEDPIHTMTTGVVVDRFVNNQCQDDLDRYSYRNIQVAEFLEAADMDSLRAPAATRHASITKALIDDRNNGSVTRDNLAGNCRLSHGPINARQLYTELLKSVSETWNWLHFPFRCKFSATNTYIANCSPRSC